MQKADDEWKYEICLARLEVAEKLGWPLAIFLAVAVAQQTTWYWGVGSGILCYVVAVQPYRRAETEAERALRALQVSKSEHEP